MRYSLIFNVLGLIAKYLGFVFLPSVLMAILLKEYNHIIPFLVTGITVFVIGFLLSYNSSGLKEFDNLKKSESLTIVFFAWVLFSIVCSIPYLFYDFSFTNACFEGFSSTTTTGATIFQNFELYPKVLFFFRSSAQWFGGMGIVVLFIAVLPKIAGAGRQMFYAEAPTPIEDKVTPRIRYTASWFWGMYVAFTLLQTIILHFLGLDFFDAFITSLSTISTGGFSPEAQSIMGYNNLGVSLCVLFFMFLGGVNYIVIYRSFKSKKLTPFFESEEFKVYCGIIFFTSLALALSLIFNSGYQIKNAITNSFFEVVATMTSTGFAVDNYLNWDATSKVILFAMFFIGACVTSTSGGIKIERWIFIWKYLKREMNKIIHPNGVYPITICKAQANNEMISQMIAFVVFYLVIFALGGILCSFL